jgi:hypothetical protein
MAFATHHRPFLPLLVASLAVQVKGFHESRLAARILEAVTIRAAPVFRRLIFHEFAIRVHMVALIAVFDLGFLVVGIVGKYGGRSLRRRKGIR